VCIGVPAQRDQTQKHNGRHIQEKADFCYLWSSRDNPCGRRSNMAKSLRIISTSWWFITPKPRRYPSSCCFLRSTYKPTHIHLGDFGGDWGVYWSTVACKFQSGAKLRTIPGAHSGDRGAVWVHPSEGVASPHRPTTTLRIPPGFWSGARKWRPGGRPRTVAATASQRGPRHRWTTLSPRFFYVARHLQFDRPGS